MQNSALKRVCLVAALLGLFATSHAQGQSGRALELISFNGTTWRYLKDGSDQGTAWTARTFNDSGSPWASGQGLLGYETTPAVYPYPFNTTFAGYDPLVLTYYFRAHFTLAAADFVPFMTMVATNFADDGAVVFLNGTEVARIRVPAGQNSTTLSPGPAAEGQYEVNSIATNALLVGDNVIAVEVHQVNNASSDIVHGMSLFANYPAVSSVAFTSQPQGGTYNVGSAVTLSATTSGGPVFYQWQTNNGSGVYVDIPGATSSNYFTGTLTVAGTNSYRLMASNNVNSVVSSVAVIAVVSDTFGPLLVSAAVIEPDSPLTNRIEIYFNETLLPGSVHSSLTPAILTNDTFRVVMLSSNVVVPITRTFYVPGTFPNPGPLPKVQITLSSNNWFYRSNYYIIVNNVRDARGNVIAPNSIIPVSWGVGTNIFTPGNQPWRYHANWLNELNDGPSDVYTNAWWQTNYNESAWWADTGYGVLYAGQPTGIGDCFSAGGAPLVTFGTQDQPTLMRTWFMWPTNGPTNATLKVEYAVDDIAAFYLNGTFLFADSGFPTGPITSDTRAPNAGQAGCKTNLIANVALKPGRNLLAVAIAQNRPPAPCGTCAFDSVFGLQLDAIGFKTGPLPPKSSVNRFTLTRQDASTTIVTWPTNAYGYALVYATNFIRMGDSNVSQGPWIQEPTMKNTLANPFTITNSPINPPGARRFYQLVPTQ